MPSTEPSAVDARFLSGPMRHGRARRVARALQAVLSSERSLPLRWNARVTWGMALSSWGLCCFILFRGSSPFGDLSGLYTDHLRHSFAVWVFFQKGLALFRQPFEQLWSVDYPHPLRRWGEMAFNYPPGTLLLFTPLSLVGKYVPMSTPAFGRWGVCFTLALSHVALVAMAQATRGQPTVLRVSVVFFAALHLVRAGFEGFYDGAWVALAAWGANALVEGIPVRAVGLFLGAALLHYRAVVVLPLGLVALWRAVRGKPWRQWPWFALTSVLLTGAVCVTTFVWMYPTTTWYQPDPPVILKAPLGARFVWVVGALALVDVACWWHATVGLSAFWVIRRWRNPWVVSPLLMGWLSVVQLNAWGGQANHLFKALKQAGFWWR